PGPSPCPGGIARAGGLTAGFVWVGAPSRGRRLVPTMRGLGRPLAERVAETTYLTLQTRDDAVGGHAYRRYGKGHYLREFSDRAIDAFVARGGAGGTAASEVVPGVGLQAYGGAVSDVDAGDAALSHRDTLFEDG